MTYPHDLKWTARLDRRLVAAHGGKHHVLVDITAPEAPATGEDVRPPLNLALVIDASGSMAGGPLAAACTAARGVVGQLRPIDRLSLVSFADDVVVHADAVACDEEGRHSILRAVDALATRGCTNLAAGWLEGCECVARRMEAAGGGADTQNRVILLSDGYANRGLTDPEELGLHAANLRQRNIYTSTIGIGDDYSPVQLEVISEQGGGRLHDAPLGEDIVAVVLGELADILETAAEDLTLTVSHPRTVTVTAFGRLPVTAGDGSLVVKIGPILAGATRQVVLQVAVPAGRVGDVFALRLEPSWRTPDGASRQAPPLEVDLVRVDPAELAADLPDVALLRRIAELWHNDLVLASTLLNSEGRFDEAQRLLAESREDFRRYCHGVPGTRQFVARLDDHGLSVSQPMASGDVLYCMSESKGILKQTRDHRRTRRSPGDRP